VFFPNYSSGNVKTNSVWSVSACLTFFEVIRHFLTSGLAFFVHLDLVILRVIQDVTNDGAVVFFTMIFIFTKNQSEFVGRCAALITIDDN